MNALVPIVAILALAGILIYALTLVWTQVAQHVRAEQFHHAE